MSGFALVFRALITGPALRHPIRVLLPVVGVAIGVAAVAAIHHANRSVTASFPSSSYVIVKYSTSDPNVNAADAGKVIVP